MRPYGLTRRQIHANNIEPACQQQRGIAGIGTATDNFGTDDRTEEPRDGDGLGSLPDDRRPAGSPYHRQHEDAGNPHLTVR
jgi:hypothetical protein